MGMKIPGIKNHKIYKAAVCNRCGEVCFREEKETGTDFNDIPNGWAYQNDTGTLCPECETLYKEQIAKFMVYKKDVKE